MISKALLLAYLVGIMLCTSPAHTTSIVKHISGKRSYSEEQCSEPMFSEQRIDSTETRKTCPVCCESLESNPNTLDIEKGDQAQDKECSGKCRICQYKYNNLGNGMSFNECLLIILINIRTVNLSTSCQSCKLNKPVHLHCVQFRVMICLNRKPYLLKYFYENISSFTSKNYLYFQTSLDFMWLENFINNVELSKKPSKGTICLMKINNQSVYTNRDLKSAWLRKMPYEGLCKLAMQATEKDLNAAKYKVSNINSTIYAEMFEDPYLFYAQFSGTFHKKNNKLSNFTKINSKLNGILKQIYSEPADELVGKQLLNVIQIIQVLQHIKSTEGKEYDNNLHANTMPESQIGYILNNISCPNFRNLIHGIGKQTSNWKTNSNTNDVLNQFVKLLELISNSNLEQLTKIKVNIFMTAAAVLSIPLSFIPLVCYILVQRDLMKYPSIWMAFHHSFIIRRLITYKDQVLTTWHNDLIKEPNVGIVKPYGMLIGNYNLPSIWKCHYNSYYKKIYIEEHVRKENANYKKPNEVLWDENIELQVYHLLGQIYKEINEMNSTSF